MEDNDTSYQRLKPKCTCWCTAHCGFSCMTDGCDCPDYQYAKSTGHNNSDRGGVI